MSKFFKKYLVACGIGGSYVDGYWSVQVKLFWKQREMKDTEVSKFVAVDMDANAKADFEAVVDWSGGDDIFFLFFSLLGLDSWFINIDSFL